MYSYDRGTKRVASGTSREAAGFNLMTAVLELARDVSLVELDGVEKILDRVEIALGEIGYDLNDSHSFVAAGRAGAGFSLQIMPKGHDPEKAVGEDQIFALLEKALGLKRWGIEVKPLVKGYYHVYTRNFDSGHARDWRRSPQLNLL